MSNPDPLPRVQQVVQPRRPHAGQGRCGGKQCAQPFTVKPTRGGAAVADEALTQSPGPRPGRAPAAAPARRRSPPPRPPRRAPAKRLVLTLGLFSGAAACLVVAGIVVTVILLSKGSPSSPDIPDVDLGGDWPQPQFVLGPSRRF